MERLTRVISGEDACPFVGRRVGVSTFKDPRLESPISSENLVPLASLMDENQRSSWAFISPQMMESLVWR